jgi:hypothetical protein
VKDVAGFGSSFLSGAYFGYSIFTGVDFGSSCFTGAGLGSSFFTGAFCDKNELLLAGDFRVPRLGFLVIVKGLLGSLNFLVKSNFTVLVLESGFLTNPENLTGSGFLARSFGFGTTIGLVSTGLISFGLGTTIGFVSTGFNSFDFSSIIFGSGTLISVGPASVGFAVIGFSILISYFFSSS